MSMESVRTIEVSNPKYIGWVAVELGKRLKDKVVAQVQPKVDRIIVAVTVESVSELPTKWKVVEGELLGVNQLLALDPLDQGKVTAHFR
jgi:hypothetical protein